MMNRRNFLSAGSSLAALAIMPHAHAEWQPSQRYPDPSVRIIDPSFTKYRLALAKHKEHIRQRCAKEEAPIRTTQC